MRKKISKKIISELYSGGNDYVNNDYFHIYSEKALFDYDTIKLMNKHVVLMEKKRSIGFKPDYDLKKNNFISNGVDLSDWGQKIIIIKMKVPYFGEGIACVNNFSLGDSDVEWFNSTFVNNFMDFKDYGNKINIIDNKICFSYFHPYTYLDLDLNLDFFKKKKMMKMLKNSKFL